VRVLVTGVTGFAGPAVVEALVAGGHEVHGSTRRVPVATSRGMAFHAADVRDAGAVAALVHAIVPDAVVHLAAVAEPAAAEADPALAYAVNLGGMLAVLQAVRERAPRARVLAVSSAAVYGAVPPADLPVTEETVLRPRSVYGASKAAAELAALQWGRSYDLDVVVARPFNHTGAGQSAAYVCAALAKQVAEIEAGRQPPVIDVGNVDPVRDWSDVRDIAAGYVSLLERGRAGTVYNLCSGEPGSVSVAALIAELRALARIPMHARSDPARRRANDVDRLVGSHARATADTGWTPRIPLRDTLATVLDDWRARVRAGA
jgi:GDP-4-dehydro-6-deoxy-D-mannose reductase